MRVTANAGDERATIESIATGFRQQMFTLQDANETVAEVDAGAGCGSDFITLKYGDRHAVVRGVDLLRAWVRTIDPEAAKRFPKGLSRKRPASG
jgi:hypothetical protein